MARIALGSFLDFVRSGPQDSVRLVRRQRAMYLGSGGQAWAFYQPFRSGVRRAISAPDPEAVLTAVVDKAGPKQRSHFQELRRGMCAWLSGTKATGVQVESCSWWHDELEVTLSKRSLLGLRHSSGAVELVLPYLKEPELSTQDAAPVLRILQLGRDRVLPGATPVVLDVRRARSHRLRANTNEDDLDTFIAGEVSKYLTYWQAAEAA
ncbi:hypothetical protein SAMN04487904_103364 [Actinopolyspora lacussalsi subsp. righensis]|uniref:Uncharacterized protein n=1 Tax=Actinopolyspora righensis TaxID=995060 RepID=A0A1I6YXZ9_9ACTN|nr:hypothetical protein [Actinopolyspora righensis]SFT55282.1 hypothetical protein SAMN04487904_103364 [Actinopolyspora righensis]